MRRSKKENLLAGLYILLAMAFVVVLYFLTSCKVKSEMHIEKNKLDSTSQSKLTEKTIQKLIDTTRTSTKRTIVTEIEFFKPDSIAELDLSVSGGVFDFNKIRGQPIRSIRQTAFEEIEESSSKSSDSSTERESMSKATVQRETKSKDKKAETKGVPYYNYIGLFIITAAMLYLFRAPICGWVKNLLKGKLKIP
ncbi:MULTISPECIES: hypothetical protein [Bacteroidales]|uniref:hypothetical protein n=1 Tax=Bacteroidales TaxID=171549 RepID=UPI0035A14CDF